MSRLDREAAKSDAYVAASLILGDLDHAKRMALQVEAAGLRLLELNIGTPYASQAAKGAVATELLPERVSLIVRSVRAAVSMPLWVKISGQSERVPELVRAAFEAGADSVVMAGRLLGHDSRSRHHAPGARYHAWRRRLLEPAADLSLAGAVAQRLSGATSR